MATKICSGNYANVVESGIGLIDKYPHDAEVEKHLKSLVSACSPSLCLICPFKQRMDLQPQISPKEDKTYLLADYWQELPDGTTQIDFGYILYSCQMSTQLSTIRTELGIHESNNFMNLSASNKHNIQYLEKLIGIHALPSLENSKLKGSVGRVLNHFKDMADLRLELGKYITIIPDEEERRFRILHNTAIMMIDNQYFMNIGDKKRDAIGYTMAKYFSAVWHAYPLTRKA